MELQQIGVQHPRIKQLLSIQRNTAPNRHKLFVAEGLWAHKVLLETDTPVDTFFWCPEAIYSDEARKRSEELARRTRRAYRISERTLARVCEIKPDGLVSIARMPTWEPDVLAFGESALVLVADGVEIPGNLGTLLRTLDACRADCMVMTNRKTRLTHPKVFRGSQGMSLRVPTLEFEDPRDAVTWLTERSFDVYLADTDDAESYRSPTYYRRRTAFVVGSERYGISREWYEHGFARVAVPMLGSADSLNVAISASILLYEARAQKERW